MSSSSDEAQVSAARDHLAMVLAGFVQATGARGAAVVGRDGLPLLSSLPPSVNRETFAAMSATMMGAAETAAAQMTDQSATRVVADFEDWQLIALEAGPEALLVIVSERRKANAELMAASAALAAEIRPMF